MEKGYLLKSWLKSSMTGVKKECSKFSVISKGVTILKLPYQRILVPRKWEDTIKKSQQFNNHIGLFLKIGVSQCECKLQKRSKEECSQHPVCDSTTVNNCNVSHNSSQIHIPLSNIYLSYHSYMQYSQSSQFDKP